MTKPVICDVFALQGVSSFNEKSLRRVGTEFRLHTKYLNLLLNRDDIDASPYNAVAIASPEDDSRALLVVSSAELDDLYEQVTFKDAEQAWFTKRDDLGQQAFADLPFFRELIETPPVNRKRYLGAIVLD